MSWFKLKKNDQEAKKSKNKQLTGDTIRIRVNRLVNNTPVEVAVFDAELKKDGNDNSIIINDSTNFKEELPGITDSLINDILYKLESRSLTREAQIDRVKKAIEAQQTLVSEAKNGYIIKKNKKVVEGKEVITDEKVKINIESEKSKLRLYKCVRYTLENKKGEGFFESIEQDGMRCLKYAIRDGELIPYWHKTPNSDEEPILLVPDISLRKKFYKESMEEAIQDFNESQDTMWRGILGVITKALYIILALGLIVWTVYLARWSADMSDKDLQPKIDALKLQIENTRQACSSQIANQIENNGVLIDYAKGVLEGRISEAVNEPPDKANMQI